MQDTLTIQTSDTQNPGKDADRCTLVRTAHHDTTGTLDFKPLTDQNLRRVATALAHGTSRTCDYTLGGIYMWIDRFAYRGAFADGTLFIKGVLENNPRVTGFSLPIGPMPMARAIALVQRYCHSHGLPAIFSAIPEDRIESFMAVNPGLAIEELDDWADYLYDIESLAGLRGKKMNKKRNHVNRFMAQFKDFVVQDLDRVPLDEQLRFVDAAGRAELDAGPDDAGTAALAAYELDQCRKTLAQRQIYGFDGIALRTAADAPLAAIAAAEVIGDTAYIHIEKVDHGVAGAGETINTLFAQRLATMYPNVQYINREEDVGDPGLRKAKLSYHPAAVLKKFNIYLD